MFKNTILIIPVLFFISCYSFSNFQTPVVLESGKSSLGIGVSKIPDSDKKLIPEIYYRRNIISKTDFGLKQLGIPFIGGITLIDVKRSLLKINKFSISSDLVFSYSTLNSEQLGNWTSTAIIPALFMGSDRLYIGGKYNQLKFDGEIELFRKIGLSGSIGFPSVVLGMTLGKNLRIQPEVNIYLTADEKYSYIFSLGVTHYKKR